MSLIPPRATGPIPVGLLGNGGVVSASEGLLHDGDPKRADRKAEPLAAFFLRTRLATGRRQGFGTTLAITDRRGKSVRVRATATPALRLDASSPWRRGAPESEGRLG